MWDYVMINWHMIIYIWIVLYILYEYWDMWVCKWRYDYVYKNVRWKRVYMLICDVCIWVMELLSWHEKYMCILVCYDFQSWVKFKNIFEIQSDLKKSFQMLLERNVLQKTFLIVLRYEIWFYGFAGHEGRTHPSM